MRNRIELKFANKDEALKAIGKELSKAVRTAINTIFIDDIDYYKIGCLSMDSFITSLSRLAYGSNQLNIQAAIPLNDIKTLFSIFAACAANDEHYIPRFSNYLNGKRGNQKFTNKWN